MNSVICTCLVAPQALCVHLARTFDIAIIKNANNYRTALNKQQEYKELFLYNQTKIPQLGGGSHPHGKHSQKKPALLKRFPDFFSSIP